MECCGKDIAISPCPPFSRAGMSIRWIYRMTYTSFAYQRGGITSKDRFARGCMQLHADYSCVTT